MTDCPKNHDACIVATLDGERVECFGVVFTAEWDEATWAFVHQPGLIVDLWLRCGHVIAQTADVRTAMACTYEGRTNRDADAPTPRVLFGPLTPPAVAPGLNGADHG